MKLYLMTFHGDLEPRANEVFDSLEEAMERLSLEWGEEIKSVDILGRATCFYDTPDPEDDRILVWEVAPPQAKVVWHFSGWHWRGDCSDLPGGPLPQGCLPGQDVSLYELAMRA